MKLTQEQLEKRRAGMAERAAARAAWNAQREADEAVIQEVLRAILTDPAATVDQRVFAVCVLDRVRHYGLVPHGVIPERKGDEKLVENFAKMLENT